MVRMPDLDITFLGTGTSTGVPMIGCPCAVCGSEDQRDRRTRSSIFIRTPECRWVVDTGNDFRQQCLREGITELDAVIYTHSHTDHIMGFDDLRPFCAPDRPLPIYGSAETLADLRRVFEFAFNGQNRWPGYMHPLPSIVNGPFMLGETEITPLQLKHGRTHVYGYLFSRKGERLLAYLCDCKEVPASSMELLQGTRVLIVDALRHAPHPTHMNVDEALELQSKLRPDQTWFTHICHEMGHAAAESSLPPDVKLAFDGLRITL